MPFSTTPPAKDMGYDVTQTIVKRITFADQTAGVTVICGVVPAGALIIEAGHIVTVAFNAVTTNVISIGTTGTAAGFSSAAALGTIGKVIGSALATSATLYNPTSEVTLTCIPTGTGGAATAGEAFVYFKYTVGFN